MKFLKDQPLRGKEELDRAKFGHKEIAQTLVKIVKSCPTPFTIGLFGKWGSGKSTIANIVHGELLKDKIPVINFDVWKHEGDSLRRTFLKEMVTQLKLAGDEIFEKSFKLNDRIEQNVTKIDTI